MFTLPLFPFSVLFKFINCFAEDASSSVIHTRNHADNDTNRHRYAGTWNAECTRSCVTFQRRWWRVKVKRVCYRRGWSQNEVRKFEIIKICRTNRPLSGTSSSKLVRSSTIQSATILSSTNIRNSNTDADIRVSKLFVCWKFEFLIAVMAKSIVSINSTSFLELMKSRDKYGRDWCMIVWVSEKNES